MVNTMKVLAFGLLGSVASAASIHREGKHQHIHKHKPKPACTSGTVPYPIVNGTTPVAVSEASSTATDVAAASTESVVTVSVIPVPITPSSTPAVASSVFSSSVAASPVGPSVPAGSVCGVATSYVTVQHTITVTATYVPSTSTLATVSSVAASSKSKKPCPTPSSSSVASVASSATSVSSVASVASSATSVSSVAVAPAPSAPIATAPLPSTTAAQNIQSTTVTSSAPAASSSTAAAKPVGSGPYTGPKMGISWDPSQNYDLSSVGLSVPPSWAYDWGQQAHGVPSGIQYVPTLHDASKCAGFAANLAGSGATYVKHFNEPDESGSGGSGLSVSTAVSLHNQYIAPLMNSYLVGLPAVTSNNIPGTSGTGWLTSFVEQLGSCDGFKFADFHFYGGGEDAATQAKIFLGYVQNWISTVDTICPGKDLPIWISEFSATPVGDSSLATAFMEIVGPELNSNPRVGRYAYWFPQNSEIGGVVASVSKAVGL